MEYIALGDSISIDEYPRRETLQSGLGAASLFYRNDYAYWPEFAGRDLSSLFPNTRFVNLTADGATTEDVIKWQLLQLDRSGTMGAEAIVTITAGGNDLLDHLRDDEPPPHLVSATASRLGQIVDEVLELYPRARVLLGNVYDPSDGTGVLFGERFDRGAVWLAELNDAIRRIASEDDRIVLIDIHQHFLGHGITAPESDFWYWSGLIVEPNARGASEVRRLWLEAVGR